MKQVMVDTQVLYYLTGLSSNSTFSVNKFNQTVKNNNCSLAISVFSLVEILQYQYYNSKSREKIKILLTYLRDNRYTVVADKKINIYYNHLYEKCLKSKKKIDYYYENITQQLRLYDVMVLRDITISVGFIFSAILYQYDKNHNNNEQYFNEYCQRVIKTIPPIRTFFSEQFEVILKNVYNKKPFNRAIIKKEISNLMDIAFQIFYSVYQSIINGIESDTDFLAIFNNPKVTNIRASEHRNLFSSSINDKHIDKYLTILCEEYFDKHEHAAVDRTFKAVLKYILSNRKIEFNDIIDYLNLVMPSATDNRQDKIVYFTLEKSWKKIIENNIDDPYFANCYNFYKLVIN